jgi:hypothetical protein
MAFRIYKQFMCSQKINTDNGESYICRKKLKMVKGSTQEKSQTEIRDQYGRVFTNSEEQKRYIFEHFANSFKRNPIEPENLDNCIEDFLGPGLTNHPLVNSLKLTPGERDSLEGDLSLEELDFAIEGANKSTLRV